MSKMDRSASGWADLRDRLLAPYNAAIFDRFARRYANGPRLSRFYAILCMAIAIVMLLLACATFAADTRSLYLETWGTEVPGKILDVSFHDARPGRREQWKKLNYEFTIPSGEVVRGQSDRPARELTNVPGGDRFTVRYWARFPNVNVPGGIESDIGFAAALSGFLLLCSMHFALLSRRLVGWRKGLMAS